MTLHRGLFLAGAFAIVVGCAGVVYETIGARRDAQRFPQRGKSVEAGGLTLNLNCTGAGRPVVVLESGLGVPSLGWVGIQPEVAKFARVCSYDRAGYGWSEPGNPPRTALQIAKELKALLQAAHEEGPYVLVGPSFGGFIVRAFAGQYPGDVAGMVLVEASHEDQRKRAGCILGRETKKQRASDEEWQKRREQFGRVVEMAASFFGINRLRMALYPNTSTPPFGWPRALMDEFQYLENRSKTKEAVAAEDAATGESGEQARAAGNMGDRPLIVLTGGKTPPGMQPRMRDLWIKELQGELARLSTRGRQIVLEDSGHLVQFERPDAVVSAVREVCATPAARR